MESWRYTLCFSILFVLFSGGQSQLLSVTSATTGDEVTVTCSYANVDTTGFSNPEYILQFMVLKNNVEVAKCVRGLDPTQTSPTYSLSGDWENLETSTCVGMSEFAPNRESVSASSITAVLSPVTCNDLAVYTCQISFAYDGGFGNAESSANLTIEDTVTFSQMLLDPDFTATGYQVDGNMSVSCEVRGPPGTEIQVKYKECPLEGQTINDFFSPWPRDGDIIETNPETVIRGSCKTAMYKVEIKDIQLNRVQPISISNFRSNRLCAIQCVAGVMEGSFQQHDERNATITYKDDGNTGGSTGDDGGSSDEPVGAIVGSIVGAVVLLALIAVLVYFCYYRKKNKEEDYREDKPDANDANMHAAPPVFYTKPEKKDNTVIGVHNDAMDTSYDSKDSKSHGPARYANAPEEAPPRYERETSRGSNNRGYDDREPSRRYDRDEDNRRDQNRYEGRRDRYDQDDRPYRRRDDDAPRGRRYSNEDGTDSNVVNFNYGGDPNLGTAI